MSTSVKMEPMTSTSVCSVDHFDYLAREASNMRHSGLMTDYVITARDDTQFYAHKFMISCLSPLIRDSINDELDLSQFHPDVVDALISFIYNGDARVAVEHLDGLLAAGAMLEIPGLVASNRIDDDKPNPIKKTPTKRKQTNVDTDSAKKKKGIATDSIEKFPKQDVEFIRSSDGKSFVCNYCFHPFTSRAGVGQHVVLHTGEATKHDCFKCNYESLQRSNLKRHCQKHHGIEGPTFDIMYKAREEKRKQAEKDNNVDKDPIPGPSTEIQKETSTKVKTEKQQEDFDNLEPSSSKTKNAKSRSNSSKFASRVKKEPKDRDQMDANER